MPAEPLFIGLCGFIERELPAVGVEPTLLTERDFESRASANSATPAKEVLIYQNMIEGQ